MTAISHTASNLSSRASGKAVLSLDDYRQSHSILVNWRRRKEDELAALERSCMEDSCDFNELSALRAKGFIAALPFDIEAPSLSVEENGNVLVEWYRKPSGGKPTIFSVVLGKENYIFSLFLEGVADVHGALSYTDGSLEMIRDKIKKHFGIVSYARSKA